LVITDNKTDASYGCDSPHCKAASNCSRTTAKRPLNRIRNGKEAEPSKKEPNKNPGFAKNRTEPESKKIARTRNKPKATP